jgi:hypothetical protein
MKMKNEVKSESEIRVRYVDDSVQGGDCYLEVTKTMPERNIIMTNNNGISKKYSKKYLMFLVLPRIVLMHPRYRKLDLDAREVLLWHYNQIFWLPGSQMQNSGIMRFSCESIAYQTGLSPEQCRIARADLVEAGFLEFLEAGYVKVKAIWENLGKEILPD